MAADNSSLSKCLYATQKGLLFLFALCWVTLNTHALPPPPVLDYWPEHLFLTLNQFKFPHIIPFLEMGLEDLDFGILLWRDRGSFWHVGFI